MPTIYISITIPPFITHAVFHLLFTTQTIVYISQHGCRIRVYCVPSPRCCFFYNYYIPKGWIYCSIGTAYMQYVIKIIRWVTIVTGDVNVYDYILCARIDQTIRNLAQIHTEKRADCLIL